MKTNLFTLALILGISSSIFGQTDLDALRYASTTVSGTAKFQGIGGAGGSLGGDASMISINPACLGIYKRSEFNFTTDLYHGKTESTYLARTSEDDKYNFNFGNWALVGTFKLKADKSNGWESVTFAFGYNKLSNYNNRIDISGHNVQNSISDEYASSSNGKSPDNLNPFSTDLAWYTYLIDTIPGTVNSYWSSIPYIDLRQQKTIETKGSSGETYLAFGGNYSDKFYIGGSFAFPTVRYTQTSTYTETNLNDTINFGYMRYNESLKTTGTGFNFKLGMIYRPIDWLRIGGSVSTPTFYSMHDEYSTKLTVNSENNYKESPKGSFDYELITPMKATGSLALVFGKMGFITADAEFLDYTGSRLHSGTDEFYTENDAIRQNYRARVNYRVGGELNLAPFAVRAGYGLYPSPYKTGLNDAKRSTYSFGFGYRNNGFYLDFAYIIAKSSEDYYLYTIVPEAAKNNFTSNSFVATLGFRF